MPSGARWSSLTVLGVSGVLRFRRSPNKCTRKGGLALRAARSPVAASSRGTRPGESDASRVRRRYHRRSSAYGAGGSEYLSSQSIDLVILRAGPVPLCLREGLKPHARGSDRRHISRKFSRSCDFRGASGPFMVGRRVENLPALHVWPPDIAAGRPFRVPTPAQPRRGSAFTRSRL